MYHIMRKYLVLLFVLFLSGCGDVTNNQSVSISGSWQISPYSIWSVDTTFQRLWPDHKIELWAVPDPKISGITCFYSRAKTWWIRGWLWLAEDTSDASVSCRQTWPITFVSFIWQSEEIRNESTSFLFKKLRIVRFYDKNTNTLVYLVYSDKLIDGSPKNSISAVALMDTKVLLK